VCTDPAVTPYELSKEIRMKRLALVAAVLVVAACAKKDNTADMDTTSMNNAPAMTTDSGAAAKLDTLAQTVDSTASAAADSIKAMADSMKH
jgi:hypothetical protein